LRVNIVNVFAIPSAEVGADDGLVGRAGQFFDVSQDGVLVSHMD
jgi:hypothetical protein